MEITKLLTNEKALELTESLLQNDKDIRDELRRKKADATYVDEKITILKNEIDTNKYESSAGISNLNIKIDNTMIDADKKIAAAKSEINEVINTNKTETDTNIANINLAISTLETKVEENITELSDEISTEAIRVNNELEGKVDKIIVDEINTALSDRISIIEDDYVKTADIPVNVSELSNDSNYQTADDVSTTLTTALEPYAKSVDVTSEINTEIAKVIADAPESFDTLKEMADWISNHETDASAMNRVIQKNKNDIIVLEDGKVDKVEGKGLSTNDYSNEEKTKLEGLSNYDDSLLTNKIAILENEMDTNKSASDISISTLDTKIADTKAEINGMQTQLEQLSEEVANIPSGKDGADGQDGVTPTIGDNGNWYLGDTDTGKPSRGETGPAGQDGAQGPKGDTGADGKSAYQYAQEGGYTGTENEFKAKLAKEYAEPIYKVIMTADDAAPALEPDKKYDFPDMASLAYTLTPPEDSTEVAMYWFVFGSPADTATTVTHPEGVTVDGPTIAAGKRYEVQIADGLAIIKEWEAATA